MSDLEAQISDALTKFEGDVSAVREKLRPFLSSNVDTLSSAEQANRTAVPYALSAYALSSMLFAYLRSEGKDTALIMPELERVKRNMEKVNKAIQSESPESTEKAERRGPDVKPTGRHTKFEDKPVRVKKNKKSIAKVKKEREEKKRQS